jgi:hypothetical protein
VVLKRAKYFVTCNGQSLEQKDYPDEVIRRKIIFGENSYRSALVKGQLDLFQEVG